MNPNQYRSITSWRECPAESQDCGNSLAYLEKSDGWTCLFRIGPGIPYLGPFDGFESRCKLGQHRSIAFEKVKCDTTNWCYGNSRLIGHHRTCDHLSWYEPHYDHLVESFSKEIWPGAGYERHEVREGVHECRSATNFR